MSTEHSSKQYDLDLETVRSKVLMMGGMLERQFDDARTALLSGNVEQADAVIEKDDEIDALEIDLDNACTRLIVKRQPAANDLRMVMATVKVIADLERIGDEITKIARSAKNISSQNVLIADYYQAVKVIADHAGSMLRDALDAFARLDRDLAIRLIGYDSVLDEDFHQMIRRLAAYMAQEPQIIPAALDMLWAAKAIERVGDHSTNIAEYVIYIVDGKDIRHTGFDTLYRERPV